jgi:hypothetical protein
MRRSRPVARRRRRTGRGRGCHRRLAAPRANPLPRRVCLGCDQRVSAFLAGQRVFFAARCRVGSACVRFSMHPHPPTPSRPITSRRVASPTRDTDSAIQLATVDPRRHVVDRQRVVGCTCRAAVGAPRVLGLELRCQSPIPAAGQVRAAHCAAVDGTVDPTVDAARGVSDPTHAHPWGEGRGRGGVSHHQLAGAFREKKPSPRHSLPRRLPADQPEQPRRPTLGRVGPSPTVEQHRAP